MMWLVMKQMLYNCYVCGDIRIFEPFLHLAFDNCNDFEVFQKELLQIFPVIKPKFPFSLMNLMGFTINGPSRV